MITLKLAKPENAKELGELFYSCLLENYPDTIEEYSLKNCTDYFHRRRCEDTVMGIYDGKVVGFCSFGQADDEFMRDSGEINYLFVLKDYQKHGDGRRILHEAIRKLIREEYNQVICWVDSCNEEANGFYQAMGFRQSEDIKTERGITWVRYFRSI